MIKARNFRRYMGCLIPLLARSERCRVGRAMRCPHRQRPIITGVPGGEEVELTHGERSRNSAQPRVLPRARPWVVRAHTAKNPPPARRGHDCGRSGLVCGESPGGLLARAGPVDSDRAPRPLFAARKSRPWPARPDSWLAAWAFILYEGEKPTSEATLREAVEVLASGGALVVFADQNAAGQARARRARLHRRGAGWARGSAACGAPRRGASRASFPAGISGAIARNPDLC